MLDDVGGRGGLTVLEDDDGFDALGPLRVGDADDGRLLHGRVAIDAGLDLGRVDVLGGRLHDARLGTDERDRAVGFALAEVVGVVPPAGLALLVHAGAIEVAVHHCRTARHDLTGLAGRDLVAVGVDDAHLDRRGRAPARARCLAADGVERQHAHDLGLAVPRGLARPRARVDGDHVVPFRLAAECAQALEVVAAVRVDLDHLFDRRAHDEGARALLGVDEAAQLFGVDPAGEHVGAAEVERGECGHEGGDVKERA